MSWQRKSGRGLSVRSLWLLVISYYSIANGQLPTVKCFLSSPLSFHAPFSRHSDHFGKHACKIQSAFPWFSFYHVSMPFAYIPCLLDYQEGYNMRRCKNSFLRPEHLLVPPVHMN